MRNIIIAIGLTGEYKRMKVAIKKQTKAYVKNKNFIEIVCAKEKVLINLNEVMHIERDTRKIRIVCTDVEYTTYESLNSLLERLPENFIRCHTGYIVNMDYVVSIHTNYLAMKDDRKISIGRTYKNAFKTKME